YLSMPYIEGNTIDRATLNTREILRAMREVALAVHYAHSQGIVHRDIKPSNILLDQFGHVYLTDFGVAKQTISTGAEGAHTTDAIMGTPCYMSPEQARGETQYIDARTDVYALGSTLYRLLTRFEPFNGNSPFDILQKVVSTDPPRPSKLNRTLTREFDVVVGRAMEKERERRYPDARAYADELQRLHDGEPIQASPAPWSYRAVKYIRKNRVVSVLVALVAVMMASGAWLLLTYRFESEMARRQKRAAEHVTRGRKHTDGVIDLSGRESPELMAKWVELAVNAYDQASEEDPGDPTPLILKAATLYWSGDPGAGEKHLARAGAMPGADGDYRVPYLLGRIRLGSLLDREPIPLFLVTPLGPRFLHPGWAESAVRLEREELKKILEQARDLARPLAESDEEAHLDYLFCVGVIAYIEGRPAQAAESLAASIRGGLRGRDAEHLLGLAQYRDRAFESAVGVFQGMLNVRYRAAMARRLLGLALLAHGTARGVFDLEAESYYLDARRILTETVRSTPDEAEVLFERGVVHFALGMFREGQGDDPTYMDYRRAIEDLARAVTIDVRQSVAHRTLGQVWTAIGRLQIRHGKNPADALRKAREHLDEALLLDPQDVDAIVFRGTLHLAQALYQMRTGVEPHEEIQRALDQGDHARKRDLDLPDARDLRAQGYR
ncbi:MAG TPA: protein kinase, partial [Planctomycetota bacterium]|nr:protein kinase [Planctomycetota bacterium]